MSIRGVNPCQFNTRIRRGIGRVGVGCEWEVEETRLFGVEDAGVEGVFDGLRHGEGDAEEGGTLCCQCFRCRLACLLGACSLT